MAYQKDGLPAKQSQLNFLGGMVSGFGISPILKLFSILIVTNVVTGALWLAYWTVYQFANFYSRATLLFSALTVVLAISEVFLLESSM